jgi:hypothetical protein
VAGGSGNAGASSGGTWPGGTSSDGDGTADGGTGGGPPDAGAGAAGASPSAAGGAAGGPSGGAAGSTAGAAGAGDTSPTCAEIETEYAASFAEQLSCDPGDADQCQDRIEAAAGCDCLVFIEPKDPFAIEHLINVNIDWLDADCENPACPSSCPGGTRGTRGTCGSNGLCAAQP